MEVTLKCNHIQTQRNVGQRQGAGLPAVAVPTEAGRVRRPRTHPRPGASGRPAAQGWFGPRAWRSGLRRAPCPPLGLWRQRGVAGPAGRSLEQCALRETHVPTRVPCVQASGPQWARRRRPRGWEWVADKPRGRRAPWLSSAAPALRTSAASCLPRPLVLPFPLHCTLPDACLLSHPEAHLCASVAVTVSLAHAPSQGNVSPP